MDDRLVVTNLDELSEVYEMHGGEKVARWKCLARRNNLFGPWEAVECSFLPPGGASGVHLHSRTEQFDYVVSGSGVMTIDGVDHPVTEGDLLTTCIGTRHGIRNVGDEDLIWLVVEVSGPGMAPGVPARDVSRDRAEVIALRDVGHVDALDYLSGPLRGARLVRLGHCRAETLTADEQEHVLFTLRGTGSATSTSATVPLGYGVSVGVPFLGSVTVEGGTDGLELVVFSLAVPAGAGGAR